MGRRHLRTEDRKPVTGFARNQDFAINRGALES